MPFKYNYTDWTSPQGYFKARVGVPDLKNIPVAAQPTIPESERREFVAWLRQVLAAFDR